MKKQKHFCEINEFCYQISYAKEIIKRKALNMFMNEKIAKEKINNELPNLIKGHRSIILRRLEGVNIKLQENKFTNIELACKKINGIVIHPGEVFSFWETVGRPTKKAGYKEGLVIKQRKISSDIGGGLCQMANMIHYLVLNSPLEVIELHHHSDALFPDERRRVPFGIGTSVCYNYIDYRFKNNTEQDIQILVWCTSIDLCGELRSEKEIPYTYKLIEEGHHFKKENEKFYRNSKVYRMIIDKKTKETIAKELILDNHSEVMYDYDLIPKDEIKK